MDASETIVCSGCLSTDRKMNRIEEFLKKQFFLEILNETMVSAEGSLIREHEVNSSLSEIHRYVDEKGFEPLWLCWECEALLKKFYKYKQQIKHVYVQWYLRNNGHQHINVIPSKLSSHQLYTLNFVPNTNEVEETQFETIQTNSDFENQFEESNIDIDYKDDIKNFSISNNELEILNNSESDDDKLLINFSTNKRTGKTKKKRKKIKEEVLTKEIFKEIELDINEINEERKQMFLREEYINSMFKCDRCIISFPNLDDFKDHCKIKHETNLPHRCSICDCGFASEVSYNYHTNKHKRRYECIACMERFGSRRGAEKHYDLVHCNGANLNYDEKKTTEKEFPSKEVLQNDGSNAPSFPCHVCTKTFRWKTSLRKHIESHVIASGQKRKPYCEPCSMTFTTTANLQKHVKTSSKHQIQLKLRANGELVCQPCNRTFSSIATYQQHLKISKKHISEDEFKFVCSECGKRFVNKTRLSDHVDWEHLKNYVHKCTYCQKAFKSHTSLYLHKQVVHKKDGAEHLCDHCGKPFANQAKLRCHITALHSGETPYKCDICNARFSWHSCLSRHVRRAHKMAAKHKK